MSFFDSVQNFISFFYIIATRWRCLLNLKNYQQIIKERKSELLARFKYDSEGAAECKGLRSFRLG